MSERAVILAERRMDPALGQLVRDTCARASVDCQAWNGVDRVEGLAGRAALVIGALSAGEKRYRPTSPGSSPISFLGSRWC